MTPEQIEQYREDAKNTDADDGDAILALIREIERLKVEAVALAERDHSEIVRLTAKIESLKKHIHNLQVCPCGGTYMFGNCSRCG